MNSIIAIDNIAIRQDLQGRYCLNDLHRAAGGQERHTPKYWLNLQQSQELVHILSDGGFPPSEQNQPVSVIRGGKQQGTYVCKELVFSYAMWISAAFNLKVIRTFDAVYSDIVPQTLPEALRLAADMAEQNAQLTRKVHEDAPKVAFVEHYVETGGAKGLREIAKILNMPEKAMIDALIRDKVLFRLSGNLLPHALRQRDGLFIVKTGTSDFGHAFTQTRVTPKGVQWIATRYASELMVG
ncbi:KilA-N domain-containing protein [Serratia symbiotica]|uniref:KilA-N domain-containing protein n=1 Tax=Serratia symbiotica TaxID=138074 RepID=UPI001CF0A059|nr:KilA-N domain-containing protein [Serratia symbiotica]